MNETQIKALYEHWPLIVGGAVLAGFFLMLLVRAFKLFFWNEDRIEKIAEKLLTSPAVKKTMTEVATSVFAAASARDNEIRAEMKQVLEDLKLRDQERMAAVTRVHARQDELQSLIIKTMSDVMQALGRK